MATVLSEHSTRDAWLAGIRSVETESSPGVWNNWKIPPGNPYDKAKTPMCWACWNAGRAGKHLPHPGVIEIVYKV